MQLTDPVVFCVVASVLGLLIGSFLNVVIHRLPVMLEREWAAQCAELQGQSPAPAERFDLIVPRSRCPHCGHAITAVENVPVLSYLWLRGRCSECGKRIALRYPAVELLTAALTGYAAWRFGYSPLAFAAWILLWTLVALTFIDLDTQLLPDNLTLPLLWLGLLLNSQGLIVSLHDAVWGAAAGYLFLWSVYWLFKLVRGKEGMGYGDFKLLAALGAWFGWQMLLPILLLSALVGSVVGIALIVSRRLGHATPIPFGPYLAGAGVLALFWGPSILSIIRQS